jgi:hypothetical protein
MKIELGYCQGPRKRLQKNIEIFCRKMQLMCGTVYLTCLDSISELEDSRESFNMPQNNKDMEIGERS